MGWIWRQSDFVGGLGAVPGAAGVGISVVGTNRLLNDLFRTTPPVDLRRMNGEKLKAMGVNPEIADAYLNNSVFYPGGFYPVRRGNAQ